MILRSLFLFVLGVACTTAGCGRYVFTGKREARGVWMSRFEYAGERTARNPEFGKQRIRDVFRKARDAKFNMVFFQVRGSGDAFYRSRLEPWSHMLSDSLGKDPGWDPLQFAIDEAHAQGLELHAWINVFPIWRGAKPPIETVPRSAYLEHPEWLVCDSTGKPLAVDPPNNEYQWISPGNPEARRHVIRVVEDIIGTYDVDGIHFDYIRYPENSPQRGYSHDSVSVARFSSPEGNPQRLSWDHWQREQVNQFVFDVYHAVNDSKPWVKTSAAVIGKYSGSGWTSYYAVYQDPRRWMEWGKIDFIVPMVYWEQEHPTHPFSPLVTEWQDRVAYDRHVLPGLATRLIGRVGWSELEEQISIIRRRGLPGVVFFSAGGLEQSWELVGTDAFPYWANLPPMPWKDRIPPGLPVNLTAMASGDSVVLRWMAPTVDEPMVYNVYRWTEPGIPYNDAYALLTITPRNVTTAVDRAAGPDPWYYAVTAVDRFGNEGPPAVVVFRHMETKSFTTDRGMEQGTP